MLQSVYRHSWLVILGLLFTVYGLYLPQAQAYPRGYYRSPYDTGNNRDYSHHNKRSDRFLGLIGFMARQRYGDDHAFVERMFRLFDMNNDDVIERDEFRAILQLFGIISHRY